LISFDFFLASAIGSTFQLTIGSSFGSTFCGWSRVVMGGRARTAMIPRWDQMGAEQTARAPTRRSVI
jgi:hypothetical protein